MIKRSAGGRFFEIFLFVLSSLVLYHVGIGIAFFLIPLQVVATRRGMRGLLGACGLFLVVFLALRLLPFLGGTLHPDLLIGVETGGVLLLLLGLVAVNLRAARGSRALYWLLGATAVAGLAVVPAALWLSRSAEFQQSMGDMFTAVSRMLRALFASRGAAEDSFVASMLSPDSLRRMSEAYLSRTLLVIYFMLLAFSWWAGQISASRSMRPDSRAPFRFALFRLESFWLWPLIASFGLILVDLFFHAAAWAYAAWNVGLVLAFLYGLQGLAILRFLFEKHGLPRILWLLLLAAVIGFGASPRAGLVVLIGLPALGVSETWVRYRVPRGPEPVERN